MPNNPADRRAGAATPVPEANRIVRRTDLPAGFSAPASSVPGTAPQPTSPATQIEETSGPTTLTVGAVADGEYLKRNGSAVIGGNPLAGGITGTVPLAKLTGGGANGSLTITAGLITAKVDPT